MERLDCLGDMCPVPIIKLQDELNEIRKGKEIQLVTDHSCTLVSVKDFCGMHNLSFSSTEVMPGIWEIEIKNT